MPTSLADLLKRSQDLQYQDVEKLLNMMLYGPPGGGKTILGMGIAQAIRSDAGRVAYVDSAEGWVSLDNHVELKDGATRFPYRDKSDLFALAEGIRRKAKGFDKFEVVMIDEMSSIADDILDAIARERAGTAPGDESPEIEGRDYRPLGDTVRSMLREFSRAGVHVILVAHDKATIDRQRTTYGPSLSPKLKQLIQGLMHVTGRVTAEIAGTPSKPKYVRYVQAAPSALVEAKTRIGQLRESTKITFADFSNIVIDWTLGEDMGEDLVASEDHGLVADELGTDGIEPNPAAAPENEPAYVGSDDE